MVIIYDLCPIGSYFKSWHILYALGYTLEGVTSILQLWDTAKMNAQRFPHVNIMSSNEPNLFLYSSDLVKSNR